MHSAEFEHLGRQHNRRGLRVIKRRRNRSAPAMAGLTACRLEGCAPGPSSGNAQRSARARQTLWSSPFVRALALPSNGSACPCSSGLEVHLAAS